MSAAALPNLNLPEATALALNPFPILIRSREECGLEGGSGYVAALTKNFPAFSPRLLPHPQSILEMALGRQWPTGFSGPMNTATITAVTEEEWPRMRQLLDREGLHESYGFRSVSLCPESSELLANVSYDDMMVGGLQCLLDNRDTYESKSFPIVFPNGRGTFCGERRPTQLLFREWYTHMSRLPEFEPNSHASWLVWCQMIDAAAHICERKVRDGSLPQEERRHFPFVDNCCAVCGPKKQRDTIKRCSRCHVICYCGTEHQAQDFHDVHKKRCKKFQRPGDPL